MIKYEQEDGNGGGEGKAISAAGKALKTSWIEIFIEKVKVFLLDSMLFVVPSFSFPSLSASTFIPIY